MPDRVIMVRESEWREMREALAFAAKTLERTANDTRDGRNAATDARAALAKADARVRAEADAGEPYAYEFGRSNGDDTFSEFIERRLPPNPCPDWPVKALYAHSTPEGCGREGKQIEAAARAIADAWGETWECCCTEQRGLDCDCGDAMSDERDGCDERLTREDCRMAARAALSALTAGGDDG